MITRRVLTVITLFFSLAGCSFWEDEVLHVPPTPEFTFADGIDRINLIASTTGNKFDYSWTSTISVTIVQDEGDKLRAYFKIPNGSPGVDTDITLNVRHKKHSKESTQTITIPAYSDIRAYGLGKSGVSEKNNGVDYSWYIDQATSTYPLDDCGPASVTMAIKWVNQDFKGTSAQARSKYHPEGGWWYTSDVFDYLQQNNVANDIVTLINKDDLVRKIDEGNILILCLDMFYVSGERVPEYHFNKFYRTDAPQWGHFIIIKGYKEVETDGVKTLYMEAYDPYSQGVCYDNKSLKGKDRYYLASDLITAARNWWPYAIAITKGSNGGRMGISRFDVPDQKGR